MPKGLRLQQHKTRGFQSVLHNDVDVCMCLTVRGVNAQMFLVHIFHATCLNKTSVYSLAESLLMV